MAGRVAEKSPAMTDDDRLAMRMYLLACISHLLCLATGFLSDVLIMDAFRRRG
jgi:hypothetical protein